MKRDHVGVQLHLRWEGTPYYDLPKVIAAVRDLGVGHVRDSFNVGWPTQNAQLGQVADECGVGLTLTARMTDPIDGFVAGVAALGSRVIAVEGVNEWDNTGRPDWAAELRAHHVALYAAVKKAMPNMPVLAPSLADPEKAKILGPVLCDYGNAHAYPNGPASDPWLAKCRTVASGIAAGKPVIVTETGYTNTLRDADVKYHHPVTEAVAGGYVADLVTAHLSAGAPRVFVYELYDQQPTDTDVEHGFGLLRNDGTPKPAYVALRQLLHREEPSMPLTRAEAALLSTRPCKTCAATTGKPCVFLTGPKAGQPRPGLGPHVPRLDAGDDVIAGWAVRQPEVDALLTERNRLDTALEDSEDARDVLLQQVADKATEVQDLQAEVKGLRDSLTKSRADLKEAVALVDALRTQAIVDRAEAAKRIRELEAHDATHHVVVVSDPSVPAAAIHVHATGDDANPGTQTKPRRTPLDGRHNVGEGVLPLTWRPRAGTKTTLAGLPGKTLTLSGGGTNPRAIEASGQITLRDLTVDGYAPTGPGSAHTSAVVYLGGTSAGSLFERVRFANSKMGHLSIAVPDVTVRGCIMEDAGHYGLLAATADRLLVEDTTLRRLNRGGYDPESQAASGAKVTWSDSTTFRRVTAEDIPGGYGLWWDASCTRIRCIEPKVNGSGAGGRAQMVHCIEIEKSDGGLYDGVQHYGYVVGGSTTGAKAAGLKILSSGWIKVFGGEHRGNGWADVIVQQDTSVRGVGGDKRNRDPKVSPWSALGVELVNVGADKLWIYDDGRKTFRPEQMVTRLAGLRLTSPTIRWGTSANLTPAQVGNVAGQQPMPADVAALLK